MSVDCGNEGQYVRVYIKSKHLVSPNQEQITKIWGSGVYTWDSDLVAMLVHSGKLGFDKDHGSNAAAVALFKIVPSPNTFVGEEQHKFVSAPWKKETDTALEVDEVTFVKEADNAMKQLLEEQHLRTKLTRQPKMTNELESALMLLVLPETSLAFDMTNELW